MFEKMTFGDWSESSESKIRGTLNLHKVFRGTQLHFFIALSSVAGLIGNIGQANYAAANTSMDSLMQWRRDRGFPAHSIILGLVPDASGLSDIIENQEQRRRRYKHTEDTEIMTYEIQKLVQLIVNGIVSVPAQLVAGMNDSLPRRNAMSSWQFDRKFDHRAHLHASEAASSSSQLSALLKQAESASSALHVVKNALQDYLARAMATTADTIDAELPLFALGGTLISPDYTSFANAVECVASY